ncbi:MAG: NAD-dependent malic enzyme [Chloroflexaceae bacterium]|jgi:malate dehydrogenase (oxaloacetate-decarboxylating)|nr:NAD-dependent malic enzyme [Chloroflexaceae bacterium]
MFRVVQDAQSNERWLEVALRGSQLLETPLLNKSSAFSEEERRELGLLGLLPPHVSTMDEQLARAYENYRHKTSDEERYIFLSSLQDRNETLFYRLLSEHIVEMTPIIYTPVVGLASQHYSHNFRRPRGLYIPFTHREEIAAMLRNVALPDVRAIVVTDGERILGLGDLGVGGMGIPIGKLALYSLCAGIDPATTLPIVLDLGTNNQELLADPLYLGWRHERVRGADYDSFIEAFVQAVMAVFPQALLQWEDFAKGNAARLLERYRDRLCTFNDDIQGTGAVTLAGLLAAMAATGQRLRDQRIVNYGAGSAAQGITEQIVAAMRSEGASFDEARAAIWLVDSKGLVHDGRSDLAEEPFKLTFARPAEQSLGWPVERQDRIGLAEVVTQVCPTVLIGTAAQPGAFSEAIVRTMAAHTPHPVIFPLSNPTSKCEAAPADLMNWSEGRALVATGSPFADVNYGERTIKIGQCNNVFIFPGVALGVLASGARRVSDEMFVAAARALSTFAPIRSDPNASLYPQLTAVRAVSRQVALAVGAEAQQAGLAPQTTPEELAQQVDATVWQPEYLPMRLREV